MNGVTVYVSRQYPNGLTERAYRRLLERDSQAKSWNWQIMRRDADVYALGAVRHPDHKTIVLPFWHRVFMSAESAAAGSLKGLVFLD